MTASPVSIVWVRRGEFIQAPSLGETREPLMVISPCPAGDLFHVYYCETCNCNLANRGQLEMHVEKGGEHRVAVWCSRRRVYEEAIPVELQTGAAI